MKFRNDTRNWLTLLLTLFLYWRINDSNTRIRISTKEVKANTQQVLAVSDLTCKPVRLHRSSWVASCLPNFVYQTVCLIPDSRLAGWVVYPIQNRKRPFWAMQRLLCLLRQPMFFVSSSVFFNWILFLWGICNTKKTVLDTDAVKSVYVEYRFIITKRNNNDDSNNEYDLP